MTPHTKPIAPELITVPGDASTLQGSRFADTFANDFRQEIEWTDEHERQILNMIATAERIDGANVPREAVSVFCQDVFEGEGLILDKEYAVYPASPGTLPTRFLFITDDGRQRRRAAIELNRRLVDLRGQPLAEVLSVKNNPEPWLTEAFRDALLSSPVQWFDDAGNPFPARLRLNVIGENVDLNDPALLVNNIRAKKATVNTPLHIQARQYAKLIGTRDNKGEVRTAASLAVEMGVAHDTVASALYYSEIAQDIRDAIDAKRVALRLAVLGRECICYGFDGKTRVLLTEEQQLSIWGELLRAFSVEAGDGGIADNAATRRVLRTIKSKELAGTPYADVEKRERAGVRAAEAAADRYVAEAAAADTSALDDLSKPLHVVAAEHDEDGDSKPKKGKASPTISSAPEPGLRASAPVTIRSALATKAKMLRAVLTDFDAMQRDPDEDGLVLAVADAVAAHYEGAAPSVVFTRFPVLLEAVGAGSPAPKKKKAAARNLASPFARAEAAKEVVATAIDSAGADPTMKQIEAKLNEAAETVCTGADAGVVAEILVAAATLLHDVGDDFATSPKQDQLCNHIREGLYPAE